MLYKYFPISSISDEDRQAVLNLHISAFRLRDNKTAMDKKAGNLCGKSLFPQRKGSCINNN